MGELVKYAMVAVALGACTPVVAGCALGELQELDVSGCIAECGEDAELCLDDATLCFSAFEACFEEAAECGSKCSECEEVSLCEDSSQCSRACLDLAAGCAGGLAGCGAASGACLEPLVLCVSVCIEEVEDVL